MTDVLLYDVSDGIAHLTLNRPERLNAFDEHLARAWAEVANDVTSRSDVRVILLDASGPAFCAGGDVRSMSDSVSAGAELTELAGVINSGTLALVRSSIPVVCAAHGTTAGGGLGILLASDYAIVGENSRLGSLYSNIGLTPDLSVSAQLTAAVGERRALRLLLGNELISAEEARDWGLVAEVVASGTEKQRAKELAQSWAQGPWYALGQAKRLVRARGERTFDEQLIDESNTIGTAFDTPDAQQRIAHFNGR